MAWTAVIILLALFVDRYLVVLWMNIEKEHGFYKAKMEWLQLLQFK